MTDVQKLFVFDRDTLNYITVSRQMIIIFKEK